MPATYTLIASNTLSSSAASVTFSAIPATYTDLVLRYLTRTDSASVRSLYLRINSNTSTLYSNTSIEGTGSAAQSQRNSNNTFSILCFQNGTGTTADTFTSGELYIPSYNANQNKTYSTFSASENNGTTAYVNAFAHLFSNTSAVTALELYSSGSANFVSGSSFYLYGIKNS